MRFVNRGKATQVRIDEKEGYQWILLWPGEEIDIPEQQGINYGFEKVSYKPELPKVTEGKIGQTKVETKQIETDKIQTDKKVDNYTADDLFFKELTKIKGIGTKTAKDIVIWGTKEKLIEQINLKAEIPLRDDIVKLLEKEYAS